VIRARLLPCTISRRGIDPRDIGPFLIMERAAGPDLQAHIAAIDLAEPGALPGPSRCRRLPQAPVWGDAPLSTIASGWQPPPFVEFG